MLADPIGAHASLVFEAAAKGVPLTVPEAWLGALAYTFQIYFDFSGYSDMAIGLARMFGVRLPLNFASPYKSLSMIDFWRRWHITLSRFLRDYLYIPLGGNRRGPVRRYVNIAIVMLIGGLWHGAGWTFVIWGGLHGFYLLINHAWRAIAVRVKWFGSTNGITGRCVAWALTFAAVVVAWVFFRATSVSAALAIVKAMFGAAMPVSGAFVRREMFGDIGPGLAVLALVAAVALVGVNSQTLLRNFEPALDWRKYATPLGWLARSLAWQPNLPWMLFVGCCFALSVLRFSNVSEFIYFNF
jgi:D-alanyl-lipoteichoic acid acyltransferase DltB (MBOAT superfamily)